MNGSVGSPSCSSSSCVTEVTGAREAVPPYASTRMRHSLGRTLTMRTVIRSIATASAAAALLATSACGSSTPGAAPSSPSSSGSFSAAQIQDYQGGLAAYTTIEQNEEPIWAAGKLTAQVREQFAHDWVAPQVAIS